MTMLQAEHLFGKRKIRIIYWDTPFVEIQSCQGRPGRPPAGTESPLPGKDTWRAIFITSAMLSGAWLVRCLWAKWRTEPQSVDDIIQELRKGSSVPSAAPSSLFSGRV